MSKGTYRPREPKKWVERYIYSPMDPVRYAEFRAVLTDTDISGYSLEILAASEWIQNAAIRAINGSADGCALDVRQLAEALGLNVDIEVAKIAAACAGFVPDPHAGNSPIWFTMPFEGSPLQLEIPKNMLAQHYAGLAELHTEIAA